MRYGSTLRRVKGTTQHQEMNQTHSLVSNASCAVNFEVCPVRDDTPIVAVLGTGRYGRALSSRLQHAGYDVRVGSRTPSEDQYLSTEAVSVASIVFLCVPPFAHDVLMTSIAPHLNADAILVDIANHGLAAPPLSGDPSIAECLANIAPKNVIVAKALNTVAAETFEKNPLATVLPPPARIACDDRRAAAKLATIMTDCNLAPVYVGPLVRARELEKLAHRQFPLWRIPTYVSIVVFIFWLVYYSLYMYVAKVLSPVLGQPSEPIRDSANQLPMKMLVHPAAETAMTLFALTFIAGPIATIIQLYRGNASKPFWNWLSALLNMRKELGLIALGFTVLHAIAGVMDAPARLLTLDINLFYMFGILSFSAFVLMSVCSSPSVEVGLSWREARAVFSWMGLLAFALAMVHHVIYAARLDVQVSSAPTLGALRLLAPAWLGFIIVAATMLLRAVVWSPCIVLRVRRLHWDKRYDTTE